MGKRGGGTKMVRIGWLSCISAPTGKKGGSGRRRKQGKTERRISHHTSRSFALIHIPPLLLRMTKKGGSGKGQKKQLKWKVTNWLSLPAEPRAGILPGTCA
jgi:hypothetical protein